MARAKHRGKQKKAQLKKFINAVARQHKHKETFGASPFPKKKEKVTILDKVENDDGVVGQVQ